MQHMNKIFLVIVGFILLMIIIVFLLLSGGGDDKKKPVVTGPTVMSLPNYAKTGATVSSTQQGRIKGDEIYREIRVTIGRESRVVQIIQGYNGQVIDSKTYPNNEEAYRVFLKSINGLGFMSSYKTKTPLPADERGYCPLGLRYIFELEQGNDSLTRHWASSCGQKVGTFGGSTSSLLTLFRNQIPTKDYSEITRNVDL